MKLFITGVSGFVGGHLTDVAFGRGIKIIGQARNNDMAQFPIYQSEISPETNWYDALAGVDCVVHCAARVHEMNDKSLDHLESYRHVNTYGTLNLARQAATAGVKRFVFLSTIKVNGENTDKGSCFCADDPVSPQDSYSLSKLEAEQELAKVAEETGMEVVIIRLPLVYGPGVKGNFFRMIQWVKRGVPLPFGAIHNRRSLISNDNLADFILTCIDHPAASNQTFLVSDGEDLSLSSLLNKLGQSMNKPVKLVSIPESVLFLGMILFNKRAVAQRLIGNLQIDTSKARDLLNWEPLESVDQGLKKAVSGLTQT